MIGAAPLVAEVGVPCLARFGGVDPRCLDALALPATLAAIDMADDAARTMEAARPAIDTELHRLVGVLDEPLLRRAALDTRRDAYNGRRCRTAPQILDELAKRLDPVGSRALAVWRDAGDAQAAGLERAEAQLGAELDRATDAIVHELSAPELRRGIAMASPDFHDELARGSRRIRPGGKTARTALSYLSRAAVKTSPFSTLTTVGWGRLGAPGAADGERPLRPGAKPLHRVSVSVSLAVELLAACARDEELAEALEFEANATIRTAGGGGRALVCTRLAVNGFAWRREEIISLAPLGPLAELLQRVGRGGPAAFRAALGGEDPQTAFVRMLDLDVVRPTLPWAPEQEPLEGLAGALAALPVARARRLASDLRELAGELAALAGAAGAQRVDAQRAALRTARGWLQAMGRPAPHWIGEGGAAYEDVVEDGRVELGEHVRDDLANVAAQLWPHVVRSHLYDEIVAAFLELHGPGGRCADVLDFLVGFLAADAGRKRVDRAIRADLSAARGHNGGADVIASGAAATAPPSVMVRFQIAAATHADIIAGDYRLVVNQCSQGAGGLLARFADPRGGAAAVAASAEIEAWTASLAPGADVVHVGFASDWNALQAVPAQVAAELAWPGNLLAEPPASSTRVRRLNELELRHEPSTGGLALRGPDGRRVVPIYLGIVPPYLVGGPARLLMALGDPWMLRWGPLSGGEDRVLAGTVVAEERREAGRVVMSRRRWRLDPRCLPVLQPGEPDVAFLRRAHRWRREHGIPVEVFATARRAQLSFDARLRKPRWLSFDSLHALRAAEGMLGAGVIAIELTEVLPSRDEHWVRAADGSSRAAEFVALVRWPSSSAGCPA